MKRLRARIGVLGGLLLASVSGCMGAASCTPSADAVCTVAGTGVAGLSAEGLKATESDLYLPMDIATGPDGRLHIIDWNNHRIRVLTQDGRLETVAGSGMLGDGPPGPARESAFNHPTDLAFDAKGRMVVAAWHNSKVKRVDFETGMLEDVAGNGQRLYKGDGGPAANAVLDLPAAVAYDQNGDLYVLDQANQVIRVIAGNGTIRHFAGRCLVGEEKPATEPFLCPLTGKWTWSPEDCDKACNAGFDGDGGAAENARFSLPVGQAAEPAGSIVFDRQGNLYLADSRNNRIRRIDRSGRITTVAGNGAAGHGGDGGPAAQASLNNPTDVAVDEDGTMFIADTYNSCVRSVDPQGIIRTVVGRCGTRGSGDNGTKPGDSLLDRPYGIELAPDGRLFIADTYNHRVKVTGPFKRGA